MIRKVLLFSVVLMVALNAAFDLTAGPVARRLADKAPGQGSGQNPTYFPLDFPGQSWLGPLQSRFPVVSISRQILAARFALTALPLLFLLYFVAMRRVTEIHYEVAIVLAAFALVAKVMSWEALWLIADVCTAF